MKERIYWVYILASRPRGATYIGVTNNIEARLAEHRSGRRAGYASKWNITRLVYVKEFQYINDAIDYEKKLKKWKRQWKFELIEESNPDWLDLMQVGRV